MAIDLWRWARQPSTLHGLGVLAGAAGAALANLVTGNERIDAVAAVVSYALVHLGINDHSATSLSVEKLLADAVTAAVQKKVAQSLPELADDGAGLLRLIASLQPTPAAVPTPGAPS